MVNFRINCALCTGEVRNLAYPGRGECLLIFLVYHSRESEFPPTEKLNALMYHTLTGKGDQNV